MMVLMMMMVGGGHGRSGRTDQNPHQASAARSSTKAGCVVT